MKRISGVGGRESGVEKNTTHYSLLATPEREAVAQNWPGKRIFAVTNACAGCGACIRTCPEKAIRPAPRGCLSPLVVLEGRCTACAECAEVCPVSACVELLLEGR